MESLGKQGMSANPLLDERGSLYHWVTRTINFYISGNMVDNISPCLMVSS